MERWKKYFESAGTDICTLIENAITIAASDYPQELRAKRDRIAQRLFTSGFVRCGECNALTLAGPESFSEGDSSKGAVVPRCEGHQNHGNGSRDDDSPDNKVTSSSNEVERNRTSNYSFDEAEALTEEIEEESEAIREVDRIKGILSNPEESEKQLHESLRRLELMQLSVDTLQVTAIGHVVSRLKKHNSEDIRTLARKLVRSWKDLVKLWLETADAVAAAAIGKSPDSFTPDTIKDDENGLPSPPLDEGAFFTTQTTSIEMSQFFDGMDDDGNPQSVDEHDSEHDNNSDDDDEYDQENFHNAKQSSQQSKRENNTTAKQVTSGGIKEKDHTTLERNKERVDVTLGQNKEREAIKSSIQMQKYSDYHKRSLNASSRLFKSRSIVPVRNSFETPKQNGHRDRVHLSTDSAKNVMRPNSHPPQNKRSPSNDLSVSVRVEAAKRKLQEGYQQAENAKKQRTVQLMDLQDLPKKGSIKTWHAKPGSQIRQRFGNCR